MLAGMAGGIAFPILPSVGLRVGLPLALIGLILAANRATRVVVNPVVGLLTDRFGGRRTLLVGLALQVVVLVLFVLGVRTPYTGTFFLVGRVVHGLGSSCAFVAAQALALNSGGERHGGRLTGMVRAAIQIGVPLGLVLGGTLADLIGEAAVFEAGIVALLVGFALAFARVPDLRVKAPRTSLFASLRTLADARLGAIGALSFAGHFAGYGVVLTMITLLVHERHVAIAGLPERATAGLLMGWLVFSEALVMPPLGRLGDRRNAHAHIASAGLFLIAPALAIVAYAERAPVLALGLGLVGAGVGCLGPSLLSLVGRVMPPERRGLGVGALQVAADVGGSLGPLFGTALFAASSASPFLWAAGVNAVLFPAGLWLARATRR